MVRSLDSRLAVERAERVEAPARARVLLAGELALAGQTRASLLERLAVRLRRSGDVVVTTSSRPGRLWRAADMLITAWSARTKVDVAVVEVDGYAGLRRAEILTNMLVRANVPVVHLLRGASLAEAAAQEPGRMRRLLSSSIAAVSLTGHLFEALRSLGGAFEVIPDPVETNAYPQRVRRAVAPHIMWLCGAGLVVEPVEAVETFRSLVESGTLPRTSGARMTLIGSSGLDAVGRAVEAARAYGLEDMLTVAGPLRGTAAQELFAHHDVYVNAGDVDQAPIGIGEAMAAGMCVVSFDFGGAGYLVAHGVDGLLVDPRESGAASAAIGRLFGDPDLAERLSRAARGRAEALDWSRALPRWRNLLAQAGSSRGQA